MKATVAIAEIVRAERPGAAAPASHAVGDEIETLKAELFRAAQHAGVGLGLLGTDRAVLSALIACFHSRPLNGSPYVVWPSDQTLVDRTRRSRRTIHYSLNRLIDHGLIAREASATRRRFAITRRDRTVVKAYGIDLQPLLLRAEELADLAAGVRIQRQEEADLKTMIAAERAAVSRALTVLEKSRPDSIEEWRRRFSLLDAETPRWTKSRRPTAALLARWSAELRAIECELPKRMNNLFFSALVAHGGAIGCARVETLPKILNEVCNNASVEFAEAAVMGSASSPQRLDQDPVAPEGLGRDRLGLQDPTSEPPSPLPGALSIRNCLEGEAFERGFDADDVRTVLALLSPLKAAIEESGGALASLTDLIHGAHRLRRVIGLHQSAWVEALATIGDLETYMLAYWTVQRAWLAERGLAPIVANAGGLFRASVHKIAAGTFDLRKAVASDGRKARREMSSNVANLPLENPNSREDSESDLFLRDSRYGACYGGSKETGVSGRLGLSETPNRGLESKMTH